MAFERYSARKPYLRLKQSIVELYKERIRYLKEIVTTESQFEKPYLDSEYPTMHLDIPVPDWPTPIPPTPKPPRPPVPKGRFGDPVDGGVPPEDPACTGCYLVGHRTNSQECDSWPVDIHPSQYCTKDHFVGSDCSLKVIALAGSIVREEPGLFGWAISRHIFVDPSIEHHTIYAQMKDGAGFTCDVIVEQPCVGCNCDSPPEGTFTFDDASTPDTIVKNSSITVYVTGGCPPFTFATSSNGYTFDGGVTSFETDSRFATLTCADGTCGVNFDAKCNLTVTDDCNNIVSTTIRNTAGSWQNFEFLRCYPRYGYCGVGGLNCGPEIGYGDCVPQTRYEGEYKVDYFTESRYITSNPGGCQQPTTWKVDGSCATPTHMPEYSPTDSRLGCTNPPAVPCSKLFPTLTDPCWYLLANVQVYMWSC